MTGKMRVRYIGVTRVLELTHDKEYDVISVERGWYRIETDMIGDYLYPPQMFETVEGLAETAINSDDENASP